MGKISYSLVTRNPLLVKEMSRWTSRPIRVREKKALFCCSKVLKALGMGIAFDPDRANFSGIGQTSGANIFISRVKHKTFAEVNEEGTEAAAVTSIEMRTTSARLQKTFQMIVNRPFFCAIRDNKTGTVLFVGSITDPQ